MVITVWQIPVVFGDFLENKHKTQTQQTSWTCCSANSCLRFISTVWVILLFCIPDNGDSLVKTYCASPDLDVPGAYLHLLLQVCQAPCPTEQTPWKTWALISAQANILRWPWFRAKQRAPCVLLPILCQCWGSPNLPEMAGAQHRMWEQWEEQCIIHLSRKAGLAAPGSAAQFWWPWGI